MEKEFDKFLKASSDLYMNLYNLFQKELDESKPFLESRVKSTKSVAYKVDQLKNPPKHVSELHDIIGLRCICLTPDIVDKTVELIESQFNITNVYNTKTRLDDGQFGYSSTHLIGKISSNDNEKINKDKKYNYENLQFEIQVRTLSEHIFAALSHKNSYKTGKYINSEIKRPLFRIAALSEVIDNEINNFEKARKAYIEEYAVNEEEKINIDNLKLILPTLLDTKRNIDDFEPYDDLARDLQAFNVKSIEDLKDLVEKNFKNFRQFELKKIGELKERLTKQPNEILQKLVDRNFLYGYVGTIRGIMNQEFKTEWDQYNQNVVQKEMWAKIIELAESFKEK